MSESTIFISYSHKDEAWKNRLIPHLKILEDRRVTVWDDRKIDLGDDWYPEITEAIEKASVAVCLISAEYLTSDFIKKEEIPYLLERRGRDGMALFPILVRPCLWEAIEWLRKIQMLPRDGKALSEYDKNGRDNIYKEVARKIFNLFNDPNCKPPQPPDPAWDPPEKTDIECLPMTGFKLFGRKNELKLLDDAWESYDVNVVSLVAWGGMGKSTLVNKWLENLASDNYRGAGLVFGWSFYSQGTGERVTSADQFIREALEWFGDPKPDVGSAWNKGKRLARLVQKKKTLLVLDGLEPLQSSHEFKRGKLKDPALEMLITGLAQKNPGLCVITTRENLTGMDRSGPKAKQVDLDRISSEAGRALLRVAGLRGTDADLEDATKQFGFHALTLNLLAHYLREKGEKNISRAHKILDLDIDEKKGKRLRRILDAFETLFKESPKTDVLRMLGLFNRPAEEGAIDAICKGAPIPGLTERIHDLPGKDWVRQLAPLRYTGLLAPESRHRPNILDCHPLVRDHFGQKLQKNNTKAWKEAHRRLYEFYKSLPEKEFPDALEEMAPLFAAVVHGCQADLHENVFTHIYSTRICHKGKSYLRDALGAVGTDLSLLSNFFENNFGPLVHGIKDKAIQGAIFREVGLDLRLIGRLNESEQFFISALDTFVEIEDDHSAANSLRHLIQLYLTMGNIRAARKRFKMADEITSKLKTCFDKIATLSTMADLLHHTGDLEGAEKTFKRASLIQAEYEPEHPHLYKLSGYRYWNLLLKRGKYDKVIDLSSRTLAWTPQKKYRHGLALANLALGRAHLLQGLEENRNQAEMFLNQAMEGLLNAGQQEFIAHGLLNRAILHQVKKEFAMAWADLEEVREIAERGGMKIHLANCRLEAARLHLAREQYRDARENLRKVETMVEEMGYHRRDGEIKELKEKLNG